ncbi:MAG: WD40 repeat domain-containing protein [Kiritimatiellia bacterium]|jgi:WD40 repeat protein|nr:WD40 repeat domain-containing protein [Kiritimatiellia bacterium]MDP6847440.1 WD40 repeat domain-containing protein [Kiritimatiellia bacterium]
MRRAIFSAIVVAAVLILPGVTCGSASAGETLEKFLKFEKVIGDPSFRHAGVITHIAPMEDGLTVISSAQDGSVRLWDVETGRELKRLYHPEGESVWYVCPVRGRKEVLTAGSNKRVTHWNLASGDSIRTYTHDKTVFRLAVSPDTSIVAAADSANMCIVWDLDSGAKLQTLSGHGDSVYTVFFSPDGKTLTTGSDDDFIKSWDLKTGAEKNNLGEGNGSVFTLVPSPDRKKVLVCCEKRNVWVYEEATRRQIWQGTLPKKVHCAAWSPDGKAVAALCSDANLYVLDASNGTEKFKVELPGKTHYAVAYSSDGKEIMCGSDHLLCRFDSGNGERVFPVPGAPWQQTPVQSVAMLVNPDRIAYPGSRGIIVRSMTADSGLKVWLEKEQVNCVACSPDSKLVAAGDEKGLIWLLDAASGKVLHKLGHGDGVNALAFTADGTRLVSGGDNKIAVIWDVSTGSSMFSLSGHTSTLNDLVIGPGDSWVATVSSDKSLRIWDLDSGEAVDTLLSGADALHSCSVSAGDGQSLVAAGDTTLYIWRAPAVTSESLTESEISKLIEQLGAASYRDRREASARLVKAGKPVLATVRSVKSDDPEVSHRLKEIREAVLRSLRYDRRAMKLELTKKVSCVAFHPSGRYWVAVEGSDAQSAIVTGDVHEGKPRIIGRIEDNNGVMSLRFRDKKTLVTGNGNGTIGIYRFNLGSENGGAEPPANLQGPVAEP